MARLRYVLIAVACVSMSFGVVYAEDALNGGTVRGLITDVTPAQNPIEGVEVKIVAQDSGKEFITKTDANGEYKQSGLPAGYYLISISKDGYDKRDGKPVAVVDGGDHFISLKMSKKAKIKPPFELKPRRMSSVLKPRIESLRQRLSEDIGERYDLDAAAISTLRLSIPESIETALEQDNGNILGFGKAAEGSNVALIKMLLSHPVCKAVFTRYLSEPQLQDYLEFTEARQQRDRQAVAHWITATLDKELSLRADQREKIVQSLLDISENDLFPNAMNALWISPQQTAQLAHYRLKVSLNGVLSEVQSKVWRGLVNANTNVEMFIIAPEVGIRKVIAAEKIAEGEVVAPNKRFVVIPNEPDGHVGLEKEVEVVIDDIVIDPEGMPPWVELNTDPEVSQEQMKRLAKAKLAAHTELLGVLNERATRRLALVTKGVVQQHYEALDEAREALSREFEMDLMKKIKDGKMDPEEAAAMRKFALKNAMNELQKAIESKADITSHPLYQQTIKDVLSEETFARYNEHQTQRADLHQQALRDMVVACMDMQLLLNDTQREQLETVVSELVPGPIKAEKPTEFMVFQLFPQTVDFEVLTPWQQGEFERVFGPMVWRRKR